MAGSRLETVGSVFSRCVLRIGRGQGSQWVSTLLSWPQETRLCMFEPGEALSASSWLRIGVLVYVPLGFSC